ncbi:MAG TPA: hypothetical protein PK048_03850 [Candidatus Absconditabacterales bacterium]|nr:hypothetical protein [Candidatus Absconditabacterales bacterium]
MNILLNKLSTLAYFTSGTLAQYFGDSKKANIYTSRWVTSGWIIRIKKGYYVTSDYIQKIKYQGKFEPRKNYILTYILYPNSYISLENILSFNQIIPEQTYTIGLITKNKGLTIKNNLFTATYRNIKEDLFRGYHIVQKQGDLPYILAYPEKALVDRLRLQKPIRELSRFENLRLNLGKDILNITRFEGYIARCNSNKMNRILSFLQTLDGYGTDR